MVAVFLSGVHQRPTTAVLGCKLQTTHRLELSTLGTERFANTRAVMVALFTIDRPIGSRGAKFSEDICATRHAQLREQKPKASCSSEVYYSLRQWE